MWGRLRGEMMERGKAMYFIQGVMILPLLGTDKGSQVRFELLGLSHSLESIYNPN